MEGALDAPGALVPVPADMDAEWALARAAAQTQFGLDGAAFPDRARWVPLHASDAWFFRFHVPGPFALPFMPEDYIWSPAPIFVPVNAASQTTGYYRRGVRRYSGMLRCGEPTPPVSYVYRGGCWNLQDGCHRYEAHIQAGHTAIAAVFAFPQHFMWGTPSATTHLEDKI